MKFLRSDKYAPFIRIAAAVAGQASVGVFNFLLNAWLLREAVEKDYGAFGFVIAASSFVLSLVTPTIATQIAIRLAKYRAPISKILIIKSYGAALSVCVMVIFLGVSITTVCFGARPLLAVLGGALCALLAWRLYIRSCAIAMQRNATVLRSDIAMSIVGVFAWAVSNYFVSDPVVVALTSLVVANFSTTLIMARTTNVRLVVPSVYLLRRYVRGSKDSALALLGGVCSNLTNTLPIFSVGFLLGSTSIAPISASTVLLGPLRLLLSPVQLAIRPEFSRAFASGDRSKVKILAVGSFAFAGAMSVAIVLFVTLSWNWLDALFFQSYGQYPIRTMVYIALGVISIQSIRTPINGLLVAALDFPWLAKASAVSLCAGVLALAAIWLGELQTFALASTLAAECVLLTLEVFRVRRVLDKWLRELGAS